MQLGLLQDIILLHYLLQFKAKKNNVGSDTVNDVTPTFIIEPPFSMN